MRIAIKSKPAQNTKRTEAKSEKVCSPKMFASVGALSFFVILACLFASREAAKPTDWPLH